MAAINSVQNKLTSKPLVHKMSQKSCAGFRAPRRRKVARNVPCLSVRQFAVSLATAALARLLCCSTALDTSCSTAWSALHWLFPTAICGHVCHAERWHLVCSGSRWRQVWRRWSLKGAFKSIGIICLPNFFKNCLAFQFLVFPAERKVLNTSFYITPPPLFWVQRGML
jgi:hypothetical protein